MTPYWKLLPLLDWLVKFIWFLINVMSFVFYAIELFYVVYSDIKFNILLWFILESYI